MTTTTEICKVQQKQLSTVLFEEMKVLDDAHLSSIFSRLQHNLLKKSRILNEMIHHMAGIMGWYHPHTGVHSESVGACSALIALQMGSDSSSWIKQVYHAGLLHDIGKLQIPIAVLDKVSLKEVEDEEMVKMHTIWGALALYAAGLEDISDMVLYHHERFDGKGYPYGLSGNQIPLGARIIAVADAFDEILNGSRNGVVMSMDEAKDLLMKRAGNELDPEIVNIFVKIDNLKLLKIMDR